MIKFDHSVLFRNLIMANMTLAMALPFFSSVNAAILIINGGFMLGQLGH